MISAAQAYVRSFGDFFLPRLCPACTEKLSADEEIIHQHCTNTLRRYNESKRKKVHRYLAGSIRVKNLFVGYAFEANSTVQKMIHRLKYEKYYRLGEQMGMMLWDRISDDWDAAIEYIIPIPLHFARQAERGFNQSAEIARGLSIASGVPVSEAIMCRDRYTVMQASLSREERLKNVKGAFSIAAEKIDKNSTVILLDDVITTGSTMKECVETLSKNGIKNVYAATFALA